MSYEWGMSVLEPICPDCGADCSPLIRPEDLDWRDDQERRHGENAVALQLHRHLEHPVVPKVGDIVVYFAPWRGLIIGSGPLVVRRVFEAPVVPPWHRTKYWLANPSRPNDYSGASWPSTNEMDRPITFEILSEYVPPAREATLFDMLGDDWELEAAS